MPSERTRIKDFQDTVWSYAHTCGRRTLPWRATHNSWHIWVSEVMLQQTSVERVIPFYRTFLQKFPTVHALSLAPLSSVLQAWSGLGYNGRAKRLHEAAQFLETYCEGKIPSTSEALEKLPGIGPYTAHAIMAFAWNEDTVFIETNIRTAVLYHFFPHILHTEKSQAIADSELLTILARALPSGSARKWYAALMDYGAFLKYSGVRINKHSAHYKKQSEFVGSLRQARGVIIRTLSKEACTSVQLVNILGAKRVAQVRKALTALISEGLVEKHAQKYCLP